MRRWHRIGPEAENSVEFDGKRVALVKMAFKRAVRPFALGPGHRLIPGG
jgi:hypothetical protein